MRYVLLHIILFFCIAIHAQNPFRGINYQALISVNTSSDVKYADVSAIYFEFLVNSSVVYTEEKQLSNFSGKVDVFIADNEDFSSKLYQNLKGNNYEVSIAVYLVVSGQKRFVESQTIQSTLFANVSKHVLTIPSVSDLSHVLVNNLQVEQTISWNGTQWVNKNDTLTGYSFITGTGNYSFVNKASYATYSDSSNYADTVLYAHTILNDLSLNGNSGRLDVGTLNSQSLIFKTNALERFSITDEGKIFINQSLSEADVSLNGNRGVLQINRFGFGNYPSITRQNIFFWYPNKSALRIGEYSSSTINNDTLGAYSFSFGKNNIANGISGSVAMGEDNLITPIPSFGLADDFYTNGTAAFAFGKGCEALGIYSIAFGYESKARFYRSVAMGYQCLVDSVSTSSIAIGYRAKIITPISTGLTALGYNVLVNADKSVAIGSYASSNKRRNSFVFGDISTTNYVGNTQENQFMARASGGVAFYTSSDLTTGAVLNAGSGSWSNLSNKKSKNKIKKLKPEDYLPLLDNLSIYEWEYISEPGVAHIGPMAQSFYQTFGLGVSDKHISMVDADGVTLLMIKGLYNRYNQLEKAIAKLQQPNTDIDFTDIEQRIYLLEQKLNQYED
jgi:hypothetical protein